MKHEEELLVNDYYTVSVIFDLNATNCLYTYKVDNSIDLEIDDYVVVKTDTVLKVVQVREVHEAAQIDYSSNYQYKYIIDKVNLTTYNRLIERSNTIKKILEKSKRNTLKSTLVSQFREGLNIGDVKALEDAGVKQNS